MKKTALTLALLVAVVPAYAANSNVETILAGQQDLSMFYQALRTTGVAQELDAKTPYAIFAPTNAAFAKIQPQVYPCFYDIACRGKVAALLRDHIVPRNESLRVFAKEDEDIMTLGAHSLEVDKTYWHGYEVEDHRILAEEKGPNVSLYKIDTVIVDDDDLAPFRVHPMTNAPALSSIPLIPGGTP